MSDLEAAIADRLEEALSSNRPLEGLLFHGTGETIVGPLRPGSYDGVLWTSDIPVIAQQYIPATGLTGFVGALSAFDRERPVRPAKETVWFDVAMSISGIAFETLDVEYDAYQNLKSWRQVAGWPSYGACEAHLQDVLGYEAGKDHWVKYAREDGLIKPVHQDFAMQGTLYVTLADGLKLEDIRLTVEPDLTEREYHRTGVFADLTNRGIEAIVINDHAQTRDFGNIAHRSIGLLPQTAEKTEWVTIPSRRFDPTEASQFQAIPDDLKIWLDSHKASDQAFRL